MVSRKHLEATKDYMKAKASIAKKRTMQIEHFKEKIEEPKIKVQMLERNTNKKSGRMIVSK